jgi:glyceraldehyde-3-phosphate dehydrogenase/erythrose-4-phosphate dehydrogenase
VTVAEEPPKKFRHSAEEIIATISQAAVALRRVLPQTGDSYAVPVADKSANVAISVFNLSTAFREVAKIREVLPHAESDNSTEVAAALKEYKYLLQQFRADLPRIQGWLLAERARLAGRRSHSTTVESWMRATRQTRW